MGDHPIEQTENDKKGARNTAIGVIGESWEAWKSALADRAFRWEVMVTLPGLAVTLAFFRRFLELIERRAGVVLVDPVLAMFYPIDATVAIFLILYLSLVIAIGFLLLKPRCLMVGIQAYIVLTVLRSLGMYLTPFDPPASTIALVDPIVEYFGEGRQFTRDLFFSGHTSLLFLLFLTARQSWLSKLFLAGTISIGIGVIAQHVHYSIDVLVAPCVAYTSLRLVGYMREKAGFETR
jgi:hypothetical protein